MHFSIDDDVHGNELWVSDGTADGTHLVKNIVSDAVAPGYSQRPTHLVAVGERVYFSIDDGVHGNELWRSDGTADGTQLVRDLVPGPPGSDPARSAPPATCTSASPT